MLVKLQIAALNARDLIVPENGTTFDVADLHAALQQQCEGDHCGKTLIRFRPLMPDTHPCQPRFHAKRTAVAIANVRCVTDEHICFAR